MRSYVLADVAPGGDDGRLALGLDRRERIRLWKHKQALTMDDESEAMVGLCILTRVENVGDVRDPVP